MKTMSAISVGSARQKAGNFEATQLFDCSIKKSLWYAFAMMLALLLGSCHDKTRAQDVAAKSGKP